MREADGNQTIAAEMLGINRNTLRRKLGRAQAAVASARNPSAGQKADPPFFGKRHLSHHEDSSAFPTRRGVVELRPRPHEARRQHPLHRRHGQAAAPTPASPSPKWPTTPASRKCSTAASRRCIRRCTAASSRAATCRARGEGHASARHRPHRPGGREPLSRSRRPSRSPAARWRTPSRTSTSAGRRWCARRRRTTRTSSVVTDPADYAPRLAELEGSGGALSDATRFTLAKKAFTHTAAYDGAIANYLTASRANTARAALPGASATCLRQGRRTCATARTRTSRRRSTATSRRRRQSASPLRAAAGQGTLLQQHRRRRRGVGVREGLRRPACVIVKHANPCGVAVARDAARRLPKGLQDRSDLGLRRHHRLQPPARRATAEAVVGQFVEVIIAPGITAEARAVFAPSRTCAC
jgi:hypothetical protein